LHFLLPLKILRAGKEETALRTGQLSEPLVNVAAVAGENGPLGEPARALVAGVRPRLLVLELYVIAQIPRHLNVQSCVDAAPDQMDPDPKLCYRFGSESKLTDEINCKTRQIYVKNCEDGRNLA
jgi:hypothetical protein